MSLSASAKPSKASPAVSRMTFGTPAGKPPAWPRQNPAEVTFRHEFEVAFFGEPAPVKAVAEIRMHRGAAKVDSVTLILRSKTFLTCLPGTRFFRIAKSEILRRHLGAIRQRARELIEADAELTLIAGF